MLKRCAIHGCNVQAGTGGGGFGAQCLNTASKQVKTQAMYTNTRTFLGPLYLPPGRRHSYRLLWDFLRSWEGGFGFSVVFGGRVSQSLAKLKPSTLNIFKPNFQP